MSVYLDYLRKLTTRATISRATNIPASTLYSYEKKILRIPKYRASALRKLYGQVQYANLKITGASSKIASKFRYASLTRVIDISKTLQAVAKRSAKEWDRPVEYIRQGMRMSDKTFEDWTVYKWNLTLIE